MNKLFRNRQNSGITLVALVVTIVVLLILAVISIQMLRGDNGIVKQAVKSKEDTAIAREKEILDVSLSAIRSENQGSLIFTEGELQDELRKHTDDVEVRKSTDTLYLVRYTDSNREYEVTPDGKIEGATPRIDPDKVTPWDEKKNDDIVMLQCIEDLVQLFKDVNDGVNNYEGKTFKIEVDLNFQSINSYKNPNTEDFGDVNGNGITEPLITELTTGKGFIPIGKYSSPFSGNLDGQGHRIVNLMINNDNSSLYIGFIGLLSGTTNTISNINFENVNITGYSYYGNSAIVGFYDGTNVIFEDCKVSGKINTNSNANGTGAILGCMYNSQNRGNYDLSMKNCENNADITSGTTGGIIGKFNYGRILTIDNCINRGIVSGNSCGRRHRRKFK